MSKSQETIKFLKVRDVKSPSRAYQTDAGIDFFVPKFDKKFIEDFKSKNPLLYSESYTMSSNSNVLTLSGCSCITTKCDTPNQSINYNITDNNNTIVKFDENEGKNYICLLPHQRMLIPSGIHCRMSTTNKALIANNKSGIATKYGIIFGASVVDYSYKGEVHISIINTSTSLVRIYEDMKIIQFIETPIFTNPIEITEGSNQTDIDNFYIDMIDDRKNGGFGSTDK